MNENKFILDITKEIQLLKKEAASNIMEIGRVELGPDATLKQICNHVGPMLGLSEKECLELFISTKTGGAI